MRKPRPTKKVVVDSDASEDDFAPDSESDIELDESFEEEDREAVGKIVVQVSNLSIIQNHNMDFHFPYFVFTID